MSRVAVLADRVVSRSLVMDGILITVSIAMMAVLAQISIPLWPVPVTLSTLAVMLIAASLGTARGTVSIVGYLSAGALGLPVFAGAVSLSAVRPTFGYLVGFVLAAVVIGYFVSKGADNSFFKMAAVFTLASAIIYTTGATWLVTGFGMDIQQAIAVGVVPFLIGDALKVLLASSLITGARKLLN